MYGQSTRIRFANITEDGQTFRLALIDDDGHEYQMEARPVYEVGGEVLVLRQMERVERGK